jgi:cytoskeletal protein CcmA (bactofilin family)
MFKKDKSIPRDQVDTLIGPQVVLRGDLQFGGGLYVEGRIIGKVSTVDGDKAVLTVSEQGVVEGELRAPIVVINGQLVGDVYAERVELLGQARVQGNVHYKVVEMAAGAVLTGRLIHVDTVVDHLASDTVIEANFSRT